MNVSRQNDDSLTTLPPRFGLSHLLLWMTCCAIYLAAVGKMSEQEPGAIGLAIVSFIAFGYGAALSGLLIFLSRRIRRERWPIEPGEWLVLALGAQLSAELAIAEGIETVEHLALLQSLDCNYGQGYLFSKPVGPEEAVKYLAPDFRFTIQTEGAEEIAREKSAEKAAEQSTEKPAELPAVQLAEQPTEQPAEQSTEQPAEQSTELAAEQPTEQSTEKSAEQSTEKSAEQSAEKAA